MRWLWGWARHWATRPTYHNWQRRAWFLAASWTPQDWALGLGLRGGTGSITVGLFLRLGPLWVDVGRQKPSPRSTLDLERMRMRLRAARGH